MSENIVTVPPGERYFTIRRDFTAPRPLIYRCYTEPQHLVRFWGPRDAKATVTVDLQVGGVWRTTWRYPQGGEYSYASVYLDIEAPARLHYRDAPLDWTFGLDGLPPAELVSTIALSEADGVTSVLATVEWTSVAARDQAVANGFTGMVSLGNDRLTELLETLAGAGGR
jgi:uncharacterized protein YndB with AHSA1/START domain